MNCDSIQELLEAYALDALDPAERRAVDQHLADCPDCARTVAAYREVLARLPEALAAVSPQRAPAALRARLLQTLAHEQDGRNSLVPSAADSKGAGPGSAPPQGTERRGTDHRAAAARGPNFAFWTARVQRLRLALIALGILLALLLIWSIQLNVSLARERALRAEFADLVGQQEIVLEVVDSNETVRRVLLPPQHSADLPPYGKLFTRTDMIHVVAMAARLDPPPPGQAYHLWLTRHNETELAGLLRINADGFGLLVFDAAVDGPEYDAAWVTLQPIGGDTPQGDAVIRWQASP